MCSDKDCHKASLQLGKVLAGSSGSDETRGIGLGIVDIHVLARVVNVELGELGEVHANVVLVGEGIVDLSDFRETLKDAVLHEVHGSLDGSRVISGESVSSDFTNTSVNSGVVDVAEDSSGVGGEGPGAVNSSGEDTIPDFRKDGEVILVETVESRASGLQDQKLSKTGLDVDLVTLAVVINLGGGNILTITDEGVGVGLALDVQTSPLVLDDINVSAGDPVVLVEHVGGDLLGKDFNVVDVLAALGKNVDGVLAGVSGNDNRVVSLGVGGLNITFKKKSDLLCKSALQSI